MTTLLTAGFVEPVREMAVTLAALADWPLNVGLQAGARAEDDGVLEALLAAGACGFKIHEDYGAYPELIDHVLRFADAHDVSVALHTDGLHESAELEDTVAAIAGRTVHAYHVEGSGGGHTPDVIGLVREPNVICSSTTPTVPWGVHAAAEQVPMIILNHGASFGVREDVELVRERVHETTMAAEGPLHELGAIAIVNSDSQGMGRMMETVRRTVQLAHVMRGWSGADLGPDPRRHRAGPALPRQGHHRAGHHPRHQRPRGVASAGASRRHRPVGTGLLRGQAARRAQGWVPGVDAAGRGQRQRRGAEPTRYRPEWGGLGRAAPRLSATFVAAGAAAALRPSLGIDGRQVIAVRGTRGLTRASLVHNRTTVPIDVDPRDGTVRLGGAVLAIEPVREVPLSRRYLLR